MSIYSTTHDKTVPNNTAQLDGVVCNYAHCPQLCGQCVNGTFSSCLLLLTTVCQVTCMEHLWFTVVSCQTYSQRDACTQHASITQYTRLVSQGGSANLSSYKEHKNVYICTYMLPHCTHHHTTYTYTQYRSLHVGRLSERYLTFQKLYYVAYGILQRNQRSNF